MGGEGGEQEETREQEMDEEKMEKTGERVGKKRKGDDINTHTHTHTTHTHWCVLLCFIIPILGNRYGPGVNSLRQ